MAWANAALGCLRGIAVTPLWNLMESGELSVEGGRESGSDYGVQGALWRVRSSFPLPLSTIEKSCGEAVPTSMNCKEGKQLEDQP